MASSDTKRPVVCVFCGSTSGKNPIHLETARALAHIFHENNIQLVYGGGTVGLMGEMARTLVALSGPQSVHGVIPRALVRVEPGHNTTESSIAGKTAERTTSATESEWGMTTIVPDMHTRKRLMAEKVREGGPGSGFVALAGGFGTIEEVMEMTTWNQLGIHKVGVVLLNVAGYWDGLLAWVRNAVAEGFISEVNGRILVEAKDVAEVWPKLVGYQVSEGQMKLDWEDE